MSCWDQLIITYKQVMLMEAQKIETMKMHLEAIKSCSQEEALMNYGVIAYMQAIEIETKTYEAMKGTLKKYETAKTIHEE